MIGVSAGSRPSLLVCDGPCCGAALSQALTAVGGDVRIEVATCLSECEKAPVVRLRYDVEDDTRESVLLSGAEEPDLARELQTWLRIGAPASLPPRLLAARFAPGEGGGCLCDEAEGPVSAPTEGEVLRG